MFHCGVYTRLRKMFSSAPQSCVFVQTLMVPAATPGAATTRLSSLLGVVFVTLVNGRASNGTPAALDWNSVPWLVRSRRKPLADRPH